MKIFITLVFSILILVSCQNQQTQKETTKKETISIEKQVNGVVYGKSINDDNITDATNLPSLLKSNNEKNLKLRGEVYEVCQGSGCWVEIEIGNGEIVHITFKDEAFTLPKDIAGKNAVISGIASTEIISVEMQKRIAKKEGLTQEKINNITEPLTEYYFEADGVTLIKEEL